MTRNRRGSDDPRPLLGLLAVVAGFALLRLLDRLDPDRISSLPLRSASLPIALGATVIASALARQRHVATGRTLGARRPVAIVPADEFDAAPELVGKASPPSSPAPAAGSAAGGTGAPPRFGSA
jgi:hypothetical protein